MLLAQVLHRRSQAGDTLSEDRLAETMSRRVGMMSMKGEGTLYLSTSCIFSPDLTSFFALFLGPDLGARHFTNLSVASLGIAPSTAVVRSRISSHPCTFIACTHLVVSAMRSYCTKSSSSSVFL